LDLQHFLQLQTDGKLNPDVVHAENNRFCFTAANKAAVVAVVKAARARVTGAGSYDSKIQQAFNDVLRVKLHELIDEYKAVGIVLSFPHVLAVAGTRMSRMLALLWNDAPTDAELTSAWLVRLLYLSLASCVWVTGVGCNQTTHRLLTRHTGSTLPGGSTSCPVVFQSRNVNARGKPPHVQASWLAIKCPSKVLADLHLRMFDPRITFSADPMDFINNEDTLPFMSFDVLGIRHNKVRHSPLITTS
jgi:hypothetical protein